MNELEPEEHQRESLQYDLTRLELLPCFRVSESRHPSTSLAIRVFNSLEDFEENVRCASLAVL
jgi:hypothetical protein